MRFSLLLVLKSITDICIWINLDPCDWWGQVLSSQSFLWPQFRLSVPFFLLGSSALSVCPAVKAFISVTMDVWIWWNLVKVLELGFSWLYQNFKQVCLVMTTLWHNSLFYYFFCVCYIAKGENSVVKGNLTTTVLSLC